LRIFYFLWDDPLFGPYPSNADELADPEFIELRRTVRLLSLELLYVEQAKLKRQIDNYREAVAREIWTWQQLSELVPFEAKEKIAVERRINMMDPDFSFSKSVFFDEGSGPLESAV